jgi:hypothetical protein
LVGRLKTPYQQPSPTVSGASGWFYCKEIWNSGCSLAVDILLSCYVTLFCELKQSVYRMWRPVFPLRACTLKIRKCYQRCHFMSCHALSCNVSRHVTSRHVKSVNRMWLPVFPLRACTLKIRKCHQRCHVVMSCLFM